MATTSRRGYGAAGSGGGMRKGWEMRVGNAGRFVAPLVVWCGCNPCGAGDVCVVAGTGEAGFNGDDLPADESNLYWPSDVFVDATNRPVIVDYNNFRIRAVAEDGSLETIAGSGMHAYATVGASALESGFENPVEAIVGPDGALYIAGEHEGRVLRIGESGVVEVVAGTGEIGFSGDGGPAVEAMLSAPNGLAFGDDGALYVADADTNRVRRIHDGVIDTVVGADEGELEGDGPGVVLESPQRLAMVDGQLWIADSGQHRVCSYDPDSGKVATIAGTGAPGYAGDDGPATDAQLRSPYGVAASPDGTVYVADTLNHVVRAITVDGTITTVLGSGSPGEPLGKPAPPEEVGLYFPVGLEVTDDGDLFVASMMSHQVLVWRASR